MVEWYNGVYESRNELIITHTFKASCLPLHLSQKYYNNNIYVQLVYHYTYSIYMTLHVHVHVHVHLV